jgi:hypothetical protein
MRLYLAGPMRGIAHWNFPAFATAAAALRADGHTVLSPAEHDRELGWSPFTGRDPAPGLLARMFQWDLEAIVGHPYAEDAHGVANRTPIDAVVLLPGWRGSEGAKLEALVADRCGRDLYEFDLGAKGSAMQYTDNEHRHLTRLRNPPKMDVQFVSEVAEGGTA